MNIALLTRHGAGRLIPVPVLAAALAVALPALAQQRPQQPAPAPAAAAPAAAPKPLGSFEAWTPVELAQAGGKICYMFARPAASEPRGARRGDIMVVVMHRPSTKRQDEVSFQSGYPFKDGAVVAVDIDGKKFEFFTRTDVDAEAAWARDDAADKAIVAAMRAGKTMKIRGTQSRNTETTDTFSLAGFGRAYAEIGKACGIK
jgi:invasion protein IalB